MWKSELDETQNCISITDAYQEGVGAVMRKSNKAKRADKLNVRHAKEVTYNYEAKERPATWAARMPAYCYTELCPDPALRERPSKYRKGTRHEPINKEG